MAHTVADSLAGQSSSLAAPVSVCVAAAPPPHSHSPGAPSLAGGVAIDHVVVVTPERRRVVMEYVKSALATDLGRSELEQRVSEFVDKVDPSPRELGDVCRDKACLFSVGLDLVLRHERYDPDPSLVQNLLDFFACSDEEDYISVPLAVGAVGAKRPRPQGAPSPAAKAAMRGDAPVIRDAPVSICAAQVSAVDSSLCASCKGKAEAVLDGDPTMLEYTFTLGEAEHGETKVLLCRSCTSQQRFVLSRYAASKMHAFLKSDSVNKSCKIWNSSSQKFDIKPSDFFGETDIRKLKNGLSVLDPGSDEWKAWNDVFK
eukprot:jgi/Tetstr1/454291/TSEL_041210.t1